MGRQKKECANPFSFPIYVLFMTFDSEGILLSKPMYTIVHSRGDGDAVNNFSDPYS